MSSTKTRAAASAVVVGAVATLAVLAVSGCGSGSGGSDAQPAAVVSTEASHSPYNGTWLDQPFAKPDTVLTDTAGRRFDLRKETRGKVTLLFFGYTHCPDVCPTTMADLAYAKKQLPKADREKVDVVMVTTDPERDTPKSLRSWLDSMDRSFIGLTGRYEKIAAAGKSVGVLVERAKKEKDGSVTVGHGAQVLAYFPDGEAHVLYTSGTSPESFAHDLPLLIKNVRP